MSCNFPSDPTHGTIFEPQLGVFYIWDAVTQTWVRTEGGAPGLVTPLTDGIMSASDLIKLNRLVVPPPETTMTAEDCIGILEGGIVEFKVADQFVTIEGTARLMNEVAGIDNSNAEVVDRLLHQHTHSFDFKIDSDALFTYMESNNKFRIITTQGRQGPPGNQGPDGEDDLSHGPIGPKGDSGSNTPFDVDLILDPISLEKKESSDKAIIALDVENISENENYLVAYRSSIGNPDACPSDIRLSSELASTWVVCAPEAAAVEDASYGINECFVCTGDLYYLNLSPLLTSIETEFLREVSTLKKGMEDIVKFWVSLMTGVFDEQKAALCCALEHCKSQSRNQDTRRYIEQSRIQAAQSNHRILIEGDPDDDTKAVTIMEQSCEPGGFGTDNTHGLPNNQDPVGGRQCVPWIMYDEETGKPIKYDQCPAGFTPRDIYREYMQAQSEVELTSQGVEDAQIIEILGQPILEVPKIVDNEIAPMAAPIIQSEPIVIEDPKKLELELLPAAGRAGGDLKNGEYLVSVEGCLEVDGQFTAGIRIEYKTDDGPGVTYIPDLLASDKVSVLEAYKTLSVHIDHVGGPVAVELTVPEYAVGALKVNFLRKKQAIEREAGLLEQIKMPGELKLPPDEKYFAKQGIYCYITADYIRWFEKCWKLKKCSGVVLELAGQDFIVVFRNDAKIKCGDNASIAWPTLDGRSFLPVAGKVTFKYNSELELEALDLINSGKYKTKIGDLSDITHIVFPRI